jgi:hypothetical protein
MRMIHGTKTDKRSPYSGLGLTWFRTISSTGRPFTRKWEEATNTQQQNEIKALTASLREQAAQIQKVSAQLATASPSLADLK